MPNITRNKKDLTAAKAAAAAVAANTKADKEKKDKEKKFKIPFNFFTIVRSAFTYLIQVQNENPKFKGVVKPSIFGKYNGYSVEKD